jgi:hypothetical protein
MSIVPVLVPRSSSTSHVVVAPADLGRSTTTLSAVRLLEPLELPPRTFDKVAVEIVSGVGGSCAECSDVLSDGAALAYVPGCGSTSLSDMSGGGGGGDEDDDDACVVDGWARLAVDADELIQCSTRSVRVVR